MLHFPQCVVSLHVLKNDSFLETVAFCSVSEKEKKLVAVFVKPDSVQSSNDTCKNYLLKIYSQHGNLLNAI